MKNKQTVLLSFISMVLATGVYSQNVFPPSGRTGINTVIPATALHVIGGARIGNTTNFINIDSATGNLAFAGEAGYRVGGNKYAFQYSSNPNYGLFFNQTNVRYEFRNSAAAPTFYIGADNGSGYFAGNVGIGTAPGAKLHALSTTEQLRLGYDAINYTSFITSSAGNLTVSVTGASITLSQATILPGGFKTNPTFTNSNLSSGGANGIPVTTSQHLFAGASEVGLRVAMRGSVNYAVVAGDSYGSFVIGQQSATIAATGTHSLFAQQVIKPLSITAGSGVLNNSATLYLEDAATGATNNYNLWAAGTGANRFDGKTSIGTMAAPSAILHIGASSGAANTAPIKLNPGMLMSILEDGTIERDSNHLYYTAGSTRYQLDQQSNLSGSGTSGQLTYWNDTSSLTGSSNLFLDDANKRLGIGTSTPAASLDINGNIRIVDGTQAAGKVLISDQNGFASWQTIPASITGSGAAGNVSIWTGTNSLGYNNNFFWDDANSRLGIGTLTPTTSLDVIGKIRFADGSQGTGKVLVSDVNGIGTWQTLPSGVAGSGIAGNIAIWSGTSSIGSNTSLFWDNINRRLGIGTATPAARLDILGNIKIADGTQGAGRVLTSDANGLASWQTPATGISGSGALGNLTFWNGTNSLSANTNLFWDNINNRLGIGNNNPIVSLDLAGNIKIADGTQGNGKVLTSDATGVASWQNIPQSISGTGTTGNISFWSGTNSLGANTNLYWDNNNHRLGIGNNNPSAAVDINGNIKIADGTQGAGKALISDANGVASWQTIGASSWAGSGNNIYSSNSGNVGIGTNNPSTKLHVKGYVILSDTSDNSSGNVMIGVTNNVVNSKLYIKSTQAFGIYVEAPTVSQYGLLVNGSAAKPGTSTWIVSSDERLKSYIKPYTEGLSQVMKINPVKFHYNAESGYDTKQEYVGVVAQQLEKVAPYMVGKFKRDSDKKEFLNVDNGAMTYMLINAVKELKADADIKETTIKNQQQEIDLLQKQMAAVMQKLNEVQAIQQQCCSIASAKIAATNNQSIVLSDAASLEQNLPNPFKNKTVIKYHLPANTNNAQLIVTNNAGKAINTVKLSGKIEGQVTLDAGVLSPGIYYYSLIIDGNKVDTKKMEILR